MKFRMVLGVMKWDLGAVGWARELWGVSREGGGLKSYGVGSRMVLGSCEMEPGLY